jgi:hypothetical protein
MFKSHKTKSNHRVLRKNEIDTYGATVFALDCSTTVLSAIMMFTTFLWQLVIPSK